MKRLAWLVTAFCVTGASFTQARAEEPEASAAQGQTRFDDAAGSAGMIGLRPFRTQCYPMDGGDCIDRPAPSDDSTDRLSCDAAPGAGSAITATIDAQLRNVRGQHAKGGVTLFDASYSLILREGGNILYQGNLDVNGGMSDSSISFWTATDAVGKNVSLTIDAPFNEGAAKGAVVIDGGEFEFITNCAGPVFAALKASAHSCPSGEFWDDACAAPRCVQSPEDCI